LGQSHFRIGVVVGVTEVIATIKKVVIVIGRVSTHRIAIGKQYTKSTAAFKANGVMFPTQPTFVATNFQTMYKGTVKFFNPKKGFGFIKEEISGKEVFVHSSDLLDKINEGDAVIFETKRGKKGVTAVDVKLS
jgi:CspA family cold shock protein